MDARPQRPRVFHHVGNENVPPSTKGALHQRHKSTGNLQTQPRTGGLQVAAKRSAFGDVSNVVKNSIAFPDGSFPPKGKGVEVLSIKENATLYGKDSFMRPAQRSAAIGNKQASSQISVPVDTKTSKAAVQVESIAQVLPKQAATKKSTWVFQESHSTREQQSGQVQSIDTIRSSATATVDAIPQPRHHKSQPQLKKEPLTHTLRRTQSKQITKVPTQDGGWTVLDDVTEAAYEDAVEKLLLDDEYPGSDRLTLDPLEDPEIEKVETSEAKLVAVDHLDDARLVPVDSIPAPAMSEPEEYWDDEEEDDLYDDQGYTTAHSYRSRGDLTTGGATTVVFPKVTSKTQKELETAKAIVESTRSQEEIDDEIWDVCMVAEYGEEIFGYMRELEMRMLPNPHYMEIQTEIQWSMRSVLMDWLIQVHHRFSLLPETLFLTVNFIDRFLTYKIVSIGKLQLVGATALLVASKYEEINCPSLQEIVFMVDGGYSIDEILKAERFMLSMLGFELGWPGPMSFLRCISKADDYDLETRTLAKYFLEVTVMDERFVGSPPSFLAAGAHCLSRLILKKGDWTHAHVHYSGYTWTQLKSVVAMILECCYAPRKHHAAVFEKYSDKRYKRAADYVQAELDNGFKLSFQQSTGSRLSHAEQGSLGDNSGQLQYPKMLLPVELQS